MGNLSSSDGLKSSVHEQELDAGVEGADMCLVESKFLNNLQLHEQQIKHSHIVNKYSVVYREPDNKYIILRSKMDNSPKIMRQFASIDKDEHDKLKSQYASRQNLKHQNIVTISDVFEQDEQQFCSTCYRLSVVFDDFTGNNLLQEIMARQRAVQTFSEEEIWSILTGSVCGLAYFQRNNIYHQNLRPDNIYISDEGLIKISDPIQFSEMSNYTQILTGNHEVQHIYVSPVLQKAAENQIFNPKHLVFKSDVFTLGMIMLHTILQKPCDSCYEPYVPLSQALHQRLFALENKQLSDQLIQTLHFMLQIEQHSRPDFIELENYILRLKTNTPNQSRTVVIQQDEEFEAIKRAGHKKKDLKSSSKVSNIPQTLSRDQESYDNQMIKLPAAHCIVKKQIPDVRQEGRSNTNYPNYQEIEVEFQQEYVPVYLTAEDSNQPIYQSNFFFPQQKFDDPISSNSYYADSRLNQRTPSTQLNIEEVLNKYSSNNYNSRLSTQQVTMSNPVYYLNQSPQQYYTPTRYTEPEYIGKTLSNNSFQQSFQSTTNRQYVQETYQDGSQYIGALLDGVRDGRGKFIYPDDAYYDGEFKNGKMHGFGTLHYQNGSPAYQGDWNEDEFQGFGTLYNENPIQLNTGFNFNNFNEIGDYWTKYEGQFVKDSKEGRGVLFLSNGEKIQGGFKNDFVHGVCVFTKMDGSTVKGVWESNQLVEVRNH